MSTPGAAVAMPVELTVAVSESALPNVRGLAEHWPSQAKGEVLFDHHMLQALVVKRSVY